MRLWQTAWRNLWRHRRRTWLTIAAIVLCNTLLMFMVGLQVGNYRQMLDNTLTTLTGHLQIQPPGYLDKPSLRESIDDPPTLQTLVEHTLDKDINLSPRAASFALISSESRSIGSSVLGVLPSREAQFSRLPGAITQGHWLSGAREAVLGEGLARNLSVGIGDEITLLSSGYDGSFAATVLTVSGIFRSSMAAINRNLVIMPLAEFQTTFSSEERISYLAILLPSLTEVDDAKQQLEHALRDHPEWQVRDWNELIPGLRQAIVSDVISAFFIYTVLVVVIIFSVLNTQLMAILERRREFSTLLALGLQNGQLSRLIAIETLLMSSLGLLLGLVSGAMLLTWLSHTGLAFDGMEAMAEKFNLPARMYPEVSLFTCLAGPSLVFLGCIIAGLWPAVKAARTPLLINRSPT